jgi:hypothetical protein
VATSKAPTVAAYLKELPPERRKVVSAMRRLIRDHLPAGYQEKMGWGVISYEVPLKRFPDTYNGQPLCYVGLAAHKSACSLYLMAVYQNPNMAAAFKQAFVKAGKKLDMGKSCVRFRSLDDLPLPAIGKTIAAVSVDEYLDWYQRSRKKN